MKHFRCMLLSLTLLSAVGIMAGCSCGNPEDETKGSTPAETSSSGTMESQTQGTTEAPTQESTYAPSSSQDDMNGGTNGNGTNGNGTNGTDDGGLMEDVTDGLEEIGEDISSAADDMTGGTGTRRR